MIVLKSPQEKFLSALQAVSGIVERRHTLPVLANVLLRKSGSEIEFTTSDLEIQVRTRAEFDGDAGNFSTTVGARKLIDILRTLPADQNVTLSSAQNKLLLSGGKSRFTLQTLPADDFPLVNEAVDFGPAFAVPQKTLKSLVNQVHFAMAVHDIRYCLNGILFVAEGRTLTRALVDSRRSPSRGREDRTRRACRDTSQVASLPLTLQLTFPRWLPNFQTVALPKCDPAVLLRPHGRGQPNFGIRRAMRTSTIPYPAMPTMNET